MPDYQFFVTVDDNENPLRRIQLSRELKEELSEIFFHQKETFLSEREEIEFTGDYNVDSEQIHRVSDFQIPEIMKQAIDNALEIPVLIIADDIKLKGFWGGYKEGDDYIVSAQLLDSSKIVGKKFTIMMGTNTYSKLDHKGLIVQDYLVAHFDRNKLLFQSYHNAKRLFELTEHYREATETEVSEFCYHDFFHVDSIDDPLVFVSSLIRKKIFLIQKNQVLNGTNITDIVARAKELDIEISRHENGKIVFPNDKKRLKSFVNFFNEDIFVSPITKRKCETSSKRYIAR